jgi:hypothetical protein
VTGVRLVIHSTVDLGIRAMALIRALFELIDATAQKKLKD